MKSNSTTISLISGVYPTLMLVALLLSGCASGTGSTVHIFGGRSQNGDSNDMEAASDVDVKDLIGDIPLSFPMGPKGRPFLGGGEESHASPAPPVAPPEVSPVLPPDVVTTSPPPPIDPSRDGDNTFLWKPVSESDGNLVVLTPAALNGLIVKLVARDKTGEFRANDERKNGNRGHYRFGLPGRAFGENIPVDIHMENGDALRVVVPHGAKRFSTKPNIPDSSTDGS